MSTNLTRLYNENFSFYIFGSESNKTEIKEFFEKGLHPGDMRKMISVLNLINTNPGNYRHREKFKKLEDKLLEIKATSQVRIACYWQVGAKVLIGVHAIRKKEDDWRPSDVLKAKARQRECQSLNFAEEFSHENGD